MKKPIHIVLDSSVYKQVPKLSSPLFLELVRYCRVGQFRLFIPEVVEAEYLTWIQREIEESLQLFSRASMTLSRFHRPPELHGVPMNFDMTGYIAGTHVEQVRADIMSNWENFKKETEAQSAPIEPGHGKMVMDAYFTGSPPFSGVKKREDIPDAFIYCALNEVLKDADFLVFVSSDKKFSERASSSRINVFSSLAEVFSSPEYKIELNRVADSTELEGWKFLFQYFKEELIQKAETEVNRSDLLFDLEKEFWDDVVGEFEETYSEVEHISFYMMR